MCNSYFQYVHILKFEFAVCMYCELKFPRVKINLKHVRGGNSNSTYRLNKLEVAYTFVELN